MILCESAANAFYSRSYQTLVYFMHRCDLVITLISSVMSFIWRPHVSLESNVTPLLQFVHQTNRFSEQIPGRLHSTLCRFYWSLFQIALSSLQFSACVYGRAQWYGEVNSPAVAKALVTSSCSTPRCRIVFNVREPTSSIRIRLVLQCSSVSNEPLVIPHTDSRALSCPCNCSFIRTRKNLFFVPLTLVANKTIKLY